MLGIKKTSKYKANDFLPLRRFCTQKNHCLCCFLFTCFCFISWFLLDLHFCALKIFSLKKTGWKLFWEPQIQYYWRVPPLNPPIQNLFVRTYFYLQSSVGVSSFYENLFESFLSVRVSFSCENLFESLLLYNDLWESIFFLSFCENKQVYESHHLKQIFWHQKQIMIFY